MFQDQGTDQEVAALGGGIEMTTGTGIGGEVAAEVGIGMIVIGIVGGTKMIVGGAEAAVQVLITTKVGVEAAMMMSAGAGAGAGVGVEVAPWTALPLGAVHHLATAPALEGVLLHAGLSLLGVKALIDAVVMDDLRFEVFRPEVDVLILEVLLLGIQMLTTKCSGKH